MFVDADAIIASTGHDASDVAGRLTLKSPNWTSAQAVRTAMSRELLRSFAAAVRTATSLCGGELHQDERRAAIGPIGVTERFRHVQMGVVGCLNELGRLSG
jgi:hypothetical protein